MWDAEARLLARGRILAVIGTTVIALAIGLLYWETRTAQPTADSPTHRQPTAGTGGCRMAALQVHTGTDGRAYLLTGPGTEPVGSGQELLDRLVSPDGSVQVSAADATLTSALQRELSAPACAGMVAGEAK